MKQNSKLPTDDESTISKPEYKAIRESILAICTQKRLLNALSIYELPLKEEHRQETYKILAELHNSGKIDLIEIYRAEEISLLDQSSFFTTQIAYCGFLPLIQGDTSLIMETTRNLVVKGGNDLASNSPNTAFRDWCTRLKDRPKIVIRVILQNPMTDYGLLRFALEAGVDFDANYYLNQALNLSTRQESHILLGALSALGSMNLSETTQQAAAVQRILEMWEAAEDPSTQANCLSALVQRFAANPQKWSQTLTDVMNNIDCEPIPEIQSVILSTLLYKNDLLSESQLDLLLTRLRIIDPDHKELIKQLDHIVSMHGAKLTEQRVSSIIYSVLVNSKGGLSLRDFDMFCNRLRRAECNTRDALLLEWLCLGDKFVCSDLGSLYAEINGRELTTNIDFECKELSDAKLIRVCRLAVISFRLAPKTTTRILIAAMRAANDVAITEISEILINHVALSSPSDVKKTILEMKSKQPKPIKKTLEEITSHLDQYLTDIQSIGYVPELQPSSLERQVSREHAAFNMRESNKLASENSIMSLIATKSTLLFGTGSVSYFPIDESGELKRNEMLMSTQSISMSFPRNDLLDPTGWSNLDLQVAIDDNT